MKQEDLITQLQSPDPDQRRQAIIALGRSANRDALKALGQIHKHDPVPELRELAFKAGRYIQKQTLTVPTLTLEEPPQPELSLKDIARAKNLIESARNAGYANKPAEAVQLMIDALAINPALAHDSDFMQLASTVLNVPPVAAMQALLHPQSRKAAAQALKKQQKHEREAQSSGNVMSKIALVFAVIVLIGAGYWFVDSGYFTRYRYYFKTLQIKNNVRSLPDGRQYYLYVPGGSPPADGWVLVVAMHGFGGTGDSMLFPQLLDIADQERAILIAPTFTTYQDNPNTLDTFQLRRSLNSMLNTVSEQHPVNEKGVVLYGFSRGGMFATEFLSDYSVRVHSIITDGAPEFIIPGAGTYLRPIHIVYGEHDQLAAFTAPQVDTLRSLGYPITYETVPGAGHESTGNAMEWVRKMVQAVHTN